MKLIYVCHKYSDDVERNQACCTDAAYRVKDAGHLPIVPQIYLHQFIDEEGERKFAMKACLQLLELCDELWIFGGVISGGMQEEIHRAVKSNIPIKVMDVWKPEK